MSGPDLIAGWHAEIGAELIEAEEALATVVVEADKAEADAIERRASLVATKAALARVIGAGVPPSNPRLVPVPPSLAAPISGRLDDATAECDAADGRARWTAGHVAEARRRIARLQDAIAQLDLLTPPPTAEVVQFREGAAA